jgi:hypothetical protein
VGLTLDTGTIVVGIAILIFYARVLQLRGQKKKKQRLEDKTSKSQDINSEKSKKARKYGAKQVKKEPEQKYVPMFDVSNWWVAGAGALLMCLGLAMNNSGWFPKPYSDYWWVAMTGGILVFLFCIR